MDVEIIFFGDVVGRAGRNVLKHFIPLVKAENTLIVANCENAAGGFGITEKVYSSLIDSGVDVLTSGNHIWDKPAVGKNRVFFKNLVLPANLPLASHEVLPFINIDFEGLLITFINLSGRVFMPGEAFCPFKAFDEIYENCRNRFIFVDFHGEATSEKTAFAHYVSNRAGVVTGTHTHVQTADERMIGNTFYITDAGCCGAVNSVLGMTIKSSLNRFIDKVGSNMKVEVNGTLMANGFKISVDVMNKKINSYKRFCLLLEPQ